METAVANKKYSVEGYLSTEDRSVEKHEYYNGKFIKIPDAKPVHNLVATNILTQLNIELEKNPNTIMF